MSELVATTVPLWLDVAFRHCAVTEKWLLAALIFDNSRSKTGPNNALEGSPSRAGGKSDEKVPISYYFRSL